MAKRLGKSTTGEHVAYVTQLTIRAVKMTIRNAVGRQYAAATTICLWVFLTVLTVTAVVIGASNEYGNRPRGVAPELASFYEEKAEFQCLSGNKQVHQATIYSKSSTKKGYESQRKLQIPFDHVNDDYCDCDDGSDEPGTAACANGSFYCKNIGFRPLTIPSNRVNDYICDCCDGSDEWDSGIECPNMCGEQGEKARAEATQLRGVQMAGYAKRVELAKAGSKLMEEKKSELEKLKQELEEIEPMKSAIEEKKNQAEEHEREAKKRQDDEWKVVKEQRRAEAAKALFVELDWDSDERLSIDEVISHAPQGRDKSIIESIFGEPPAGLDFAEFIKSFERIRDFVRKSAPPKEKSAEKAANDDESALNDGDIKGLENEGEDVEEVEEEEDEHDEELQKPPYDEATQQLISDADTVRKEHQDILDKVADLETKIKESQSFVEFEYGNDHAWAPLKDECAELTTHQYTYRLCLFDKSTQKDRNAHSETNLGYWSRWSGTEQDKFSVQMYDKGQSCWNGPERSTRVDIQCGDELQLIEADEPAKCEYRFVLKAPAACRNPEEMEREHQEL